MIGENITAAAVRVGKITISAPPPARHGDLIKAFSEVNRKVVIQPSEQGFLTSEGRFVGRVEAMQIAVREGQARKGTSDELFSEDLW
jgi:hypothetical protein